MSCKHVLKTSGKHVEDVFKTSWKTKNCYFLEDILENKCLLGYDYDLNFALVLTRIFQKHSFTDVLYELAVLKNLIKFTGLHYHGVIVFIK